jgi:hypothetical protein
MVNYLREGRHTVTPRLIASDVAGLVALCSMRRETTCQTGRSS